jgi:ferric-dicitrate binding protein FerR (iron transport regulator)
MNDMDQSSIEVKIVNALTGQASQEELVELKRWIAESEANRKLYDEYAYIWKISGAVRHKDNFQPDAAWTLLNKQMKMKKWDMLSGVSWKKVLMAAAVLTLVFLAGTRINLFSAKDADVSVLLTFAEFTSPYGSKSKVKLPDGSTVWLNAGSILRYSSEFNISHREIYLEGEGFFDVTRDEQAPFVVQTSTITIKALGTAFNVKAYPEESLVETTVEQGAVQLIDPASPSRDATVLRANQKAVVMTGRYSEDAEPTTDNGQTQETQTGVITATLAEVQVKSNVRTEAYTSWKDPRWIIESEELSALAVKLERRYNVHFVFDDEALKEYVFSGKLEDETLEQVLETIKLTSPILYRVKNNTVYLSSNKMFSKQNKG